MCLLLERSSLEKNQTTIRVVCMKRLSRFKYVKLADYIEPKKHLLM